MKYKFVLHSDFSGRDYEAEFEFRDGVFYKSPAEQDEYAIKHVIRCLRKIADSNGLDNEQGFG